MNTAYSPMRTLLSAFGKPHDSSSQPPRTLRISYHWLILLTSLIITFWLNESFFARFDTLALEAEFAYLSYLAKPIFCMVIMLCLELFVFAWNAKLLLPPYPHALRGVWILYGYDGDWL